MKQFNLKNNFYKKLLKDETVYLFKLENADNVNIILGQVALKGGFSSSQEEPSNKYN